MMITNGDVQVSVILSTYMRHKNLKMALHQYLSQAGGIRSECIVVSDGPDVEAAAIARGHCVRYHELPHNRGEYGAACKDAGISLATGEYIVFWDDDNIYEGHALVTLYSAACNHDVGVVRCRNRDGRIIPGGWSGDFEYKDVDSMCVCVRRPVAASAHWADGGGQGTDFRYLKRLGRVSVNFVPVVIGSHL